MYLIPATLLFYLNNKHNCIFVRHMCHDYKFWLGNLPVIFWILSIPKEQVPLTLLQCGKILYVSTKRGSRVWAGWWGTVDANKAYGGSGGVAPLILDLSIRWKWVVSLTTWPLHHLGRSPLPIKLEAWWFPLQVQTFLRTVISSVLAGTRTPDRPAVCRKVCEQQYCG